jgi:DNA-binding CsgD family transcriptional regulator
MGGAMDENEDRLAFQARLTASRQRGAGVDIEELPSPPYHVRDVEMLYMLCRFDPAAVAAIVPEGLTPSGTGWGTIAMYSVGSGWGIAPYSGFFMGVELKGVDSNDGSPGMYMHSGFYSGLGGRVMQTVYNRNFRVGWSRTWHGDGEVHCEAGIAESAFLRLRARVGSDQNSLEGISRYVGRRSDNGFNSYSVAFGMKMQQAQPEAIEFLEGADDVLHRLEPLEVVWPIYARNFAMAFTPPRPIADAEQHLARDAYDVGLVALFSSMGRAAAIVGADGRLVTLNNRAEAMVAAGTVLLLDGRLRPSRRGDAAAFDQMLGNARPGGSERVSERVALSVPGDGHTVIAQALALDPRVAGPRKRLVLFRDPAHEGGADPGPALQLLGLTPAEARVAALVGTGHSPRDAADELELSLNTVRSALKVIFDKLGVNRQSELAKLVARLEL